MATTLEVYCDGDGDVASVTTPTATAVVETGIKGDDGNTILYGTAAPTSGVGRDGDFYIRTTTNYLYGPKTSGTWPSGIALREAFGGSLRSVSGKAEAGGPWIVVFDDDILDLSVSNRFIVLVDESWSFNYAVPAGAAGTTIAIKIVNDNGSFDWAGVTWPDPGTLPTIVNNANKITSLAFEKLPNGQWLGFVGPTHNWNGV